VCFTESAIRGIASPSGERQTERIFVDGPLGPVRSAPGDRRLLPEVSSSGLRPQQDEEEGRVRNHPPLLFLPWAKRR
jgi:hypothetical protein